MESVSGTGYELSPDGIREAIAGAETPNIARHTANSLKLFIKTVVREIFFFIFDTVTFGTSSC